MASDEKEKGARSLLAIIITTFSIVGITILSIVFIIVSPDNERKNSASQVFSGVLPLYGTWVGTLLAFYFAKENFDSATQNTVALSQISSPNQADLLDYISVSKLTSTNFVSVLNNANKSLRDLKKELTDNKRRRLPILNDNESLDFLVYYQDIDSYIEKHGSESTLEAFIREKEEVKKPVVFVEKNTSLAKANEERKKTKGCQDVIITVTGKPTEKVIGYITDVDIDEWERITFLRKK